MEPVSSHPRSPLPPVVGYVKMHLRIHAFVPLSRANGPGTRAVIWVQGCSLGCPGCYNPETHSFTGGKLVPVDELFRRIVELDGRIEGITVTGGEPLQQLEAVTVLLRRVKAETLLSVVLFTGFTWEEVQRTARALLRYVDILIAGRYDERQRLACDLRGSANKTVHFLTDCYTEGDLKFLPVAEVLIEPGGQLVITGIDPPKLV